MVEIKSPSATGLQGAVAFACLLDESTQVVPCAVTGSGINVDGVPASSATGIIRQLIHKLPAQTSAQIGALKASQIDYWIDFTHDSIESTDMKAVAAALDVHHLTMRSYFVGYSATPADLAVFGALKASPVFGRQAKSNSVKQNLGRWYSHIASLPAIKQAGELLEKAFPNNATAGGANATGSKKAGVAASANTEIKEDVHKGSNLDIELKGAEMGKVVTRFPPEPSGYLHIGHVKAALLNDYFAKYYKGKLILRFDDTNPSKEKMEYQEAIREDLKRMEINPHVQTYTSDHFDTLYDYAIQIIKLGKAYVDDTDQETMRAERMDGINSKNRDMSVEEVLARFEEMKQATERGLKSCLRAKINMQENNKAMRDPVIFRCNLIPHHRLGIKWKMYPTYDFACPIVDSIEGVTHALRTNEYHDRNAQYEWFLKTLSLRHVQIWEFSRVNFVYTLLSKRKLTKFVEDGVVAGWDDPRFPTVRGILRRGMTVAALRAFILELGASTKDMLMEWDKIWTLNKRIIDPIVPRYTALTKEGLVRVHAIGGLDSDKKTVATEIKPYTSARAKHKKNPDLGTKDTVYSKEIYLEAADAAECSIGEEVTLMDWGNAIIKSITKDASSGAITDMDIELNLEGDFKKTKKKLTWLSVLPPPTTPNSDAAELIPVELMDYDFLINKKKLEEEDDFTDFITPVSEFKTVAIADSNLRHVAQNSTLQIERKGYFIVDRGYDASKPDAPMRLISIPDGRIASTSSKNATSGGNADVASPAAAAKAGKSAVTAAAPAKPIMYAMSPLHTGVVMTAPKDVCAMYTMTPLVDNLLSTIGGGAVSLKTATKPAAASTTAGGAAVAKADKKNEKKKDKAVAAVTLPVAEGPLVAKLDIVVGKIVEVAKHPDADSLYVEKIDCGEAEPRTVVSGLVKFIEEKDMKDKMVLVLKNLKPASMRGIKSHAMVLCASNADHTKVELLAPPAGSIPGDRVYFEGHQGDPEEQLNPKKKVWETIQPDFSTTDELVAVWKGIPFRTAKGIVKTTSLAKATIK